MQVSVDPAGHDDRVAKIDDLVCGVLFLQVGCQPGGLDPAIVVDGDSA
jgi:hypothetical protein